MIRRLFFSLMVALALAARQPAAAQDDPGADSLELLLRLETAAQALATSGSYVETRIVEEQSRITLHLDGGTVVIEQAATLERTAAVITGDIWNVHVSASLTETLIENVGGTGYTTHLTAEALWVDGMLYVQAARTIEAGTPPAPLPPIPERWTRIETLADWPALAGLRLEDFVSGARGGILENLDDLIRLHPDVTREALLWGSEPVEVISLSVPAESLGEALIDPLAGGTPGQDVFGVAGEHVDPTSSLTASAALDSAGHLLRTIHTIHVASTGVETASSVFTLPPDSTYDLVVQVEEVAKYSDIGVPLTPVEAPDQG